MLHTKPRLLQGIFAFEGKGLDQPFLLDAALSYVVPGGVHTQPVYFRGGNSSDELVCAILTRDGRPMRYFPIGARGDVRGARRGGGGRGPGAAGERRRAAPGGTAGS